ncbi:hypothetical protein BDZ97DRAFT_1810098 [Flammula alnicola]|nr:hypothetical protein BDZ97DRAFT_1810098 [Flammula alnicola]
MIRTQTAAQHFACLCRLDLSSSISFVVSRIAWAASSGGLVVGLIVAFYPSVPHTSQETRAENSRTGLDDRLRDAFQSLATMTADISRSIRDAGSSDPPPPYEDTPAYEAITNSALAAVPKRWPCAPTTASTPSADNALVLRLSQTLLPRSFVAAENGTVILESYLDVAPHTPAATRTGFSSSSSASASADTQRYTSSSSSVVVDEKGNEAIVNINMRGATRAEMARVYNRHNLQVVLDPPTTKRG